MGAARASMLLRRTSRIVSPTRGELSRDSTGSTDVAGPRLHDPLKPPQVEEVRLAGESSVYDEGIVSWRRYLLGTNTDFFL